MERPAGWTQKLTGRVAMRSPGAPSLRREVERKFWKQSATGVTSEKAAEAVRRIATSRRALVPSSWRHAIVHVRSHIGMVSVIRRAKGDRSPAGRRRWCAGDSPPYRTKSLDGLTGADPQRCDPYWQARNRASVAQWKSELLARRPKPVMNPRLRQYVQDRLEGKIHDAQGRGVAGPRQAAFIGRNKPHRSDRKWVNAWSPEQIANRLQVDFPDDQSMRVSHEAIYQALYIQGRGALKRELVSYLRMGRTLRAPRARAQATAGAHVSEQVTISSRPAQAEDRAVPGHWEGDLIIGLGRSAIGTLVERSSRLPMLVHLPREVGYGLTPRTKNGPALAGYGAITMANALKRTVATLPAELGQSLTWDRGEQLSDHARFTIESGVRVFFADPRSPWQRGTNENTNGLLRQYFPKGTDLSRWSEREIQAVARTLKNRPRKTLGWKTPAEALNEYLRPVGQPGVATTS